VIFGLDRIFASGKKTALKRMSPPVRFRYDAAGNSSDNRNHWAAADFLSADAEANADVRKILRNRARYEVANNSYAKGMILTLANDTIGTGPRLQLLSENTEKNAQIERAFMSWASQIDLSSKLRTIRMARCRDGEVFILMAQNPVVSADSVQLDLQVIEADRVASPSLILEPNNIDGILLDTHGNPKSYRLLKYHPGSDSVGFNDSDYSVIPAENMIHFFRVDRPGQHRGIPEITAALPLFAQLRRFTLAVLSAAEAAADFAGILYTDAPAEDPADVEPMDCIELRRNMLVTMPDGWKMAQLDPKQPCSNYSEFKEQILNEIARCLNMPYNIAAGNSSGYNYASGRLDHQTYFKSLRVERDTIEKRILDRVFAAWYREYSLITGISADTEHVWFWDGFEHVDPGKEANAIDIKLKNGTTNLAAEYSKIGRDWETELLQIAKERELMAKLNISFDHVNLEKIEVEDE
jgi:lambda family phage portal protein